MVCAPGRSKGCNTCLKRRVKCDEARPECKRCVRAGFVCSGYARERIWRNVSSHSFLRSEASSSRGQNAIETTMQPGHFTKQIAARSPPRELSLVAFRDNIYFSFMFFNYLWRSHRINWLECAAIGKLGSLSRDATYALSQANFGRFNHQADIELQGVTLHGRCLKTLATQLINADKRVRDLIVPILVLFAYAASQADRKGAIFHLGGLARLLQTCGPEAFQEQPLRNAFESARAIQVVAALNARQRLFLEDSKWRTVPWLLKPASKMSQSEVLDILVVIPGILQDLATMKASSQTSQLQYRHLQGRVEAQLLSLFEWRWLWHSRSGHEVHLEPPLETPTSPVTRSLGRLQFNRIAVATEAMLYNTTLLWLLVILHHFNSPGAADIIQRCAINAMPTDDIVASFIHDHPLWPPGGAITLREPALEICRTLEWITQHRDDSSEPSELYLFAISMAMTVLPNVPLAMAWVKTLLHPSSGTSKFGPGASQLGIGFHLNLEAVETLGTGQVQDSLFTDADTDFFGAMKI